MALPQPKSSQPAHIDRDSALGRKFGKETTNYFGRELWLEASTRGDSPNTPQARH
jgi:hypothetical protein